MNEPELQRRMLDDQILKRGVSDPEVLAALSSISRRRFVPSESAHLAYEDRALPIGYEQTISQPYIVAYMTQLLMPLHDCSVLEIGTGSGYQTAVLAALAKRVYSIDRIRALTETADQRLKGLQIANAHLVVGDGSNGLPQHAPFDRILITAGTPQIPKLLKEQLSDGGMLVAPVGGENEQRLIRLTRKGSGFDEEKLLGCRFVKLIGQNGWPGG